MSGAFLNVLQHGPAGEGRDNPNTHSSGAFFNMNQQGSAGEGRDSPNTKMSGAFLNVLQHGLESMVRCEFKPFYNSLAPN